MTTASASELPFEPPGPGTWELDPVHFPRPATRYWAEMHPEPFRRGTADFMAFYGMLLEAMEMEYVNRFAYRRVVPVPDEEVPRRFQRAEEVVGGKLWREQLREWDERVKPASIEAHRKIQSVDPDALSDEELVAYLGRCRDHHAAMITQHMRYTASAVVPTGDFVAHAVEWTGVPPADLLALMRGTAPVSAGASSELDRLVAAVQADDDMRALLDSGGDAGDVLARARGQSSEAGRALSDYLDLVGNRLLDGFDIGEPTALEMPDALLRAIRIAADGGGAEASAVEAHVADIRATVPAEHRAEFDELLGEARLTYRLRDERGVFSDIWASGLMRRAALAAGRRVARTGRIHEPGHFVEAGFDEMKALLSGTDGPAADELAARFEFRMTHTAKDAPPVLGPPPPPPPDPSGLPPAVARLMRAVGFSLAALFGSSQEEHEGDVLKGIGGSKGVYEGPARLVGGPADFDRIVQGDVLVAPATTEAFNILLPLLGAIVTDSGGLLSHSAIVAREYGIPGVVGTRNATQIIGDGARVRVDGDAGEVTVLG